MTTPTLAQPPRPASWHDAVDAQIKALRHVDMLANMATDSSLQLGFEADKIILKNALPYVWGVDPILATLAASQSIPLNVPLSGAVFDHPAMFWYFDVSLPIVSSNDGSEQIRALTLGWLQLADMRALIVSAWLNSRYPDEYDGIAPSAVITWPEHDTISDAADRLHAAHVERYGAPDVVGDTHMSHTQFRQSATQIMQFVLAASTWLQQKIVIDSIGHVERHRRKEFIRKTAHTTFDGVRVVDLRKAVRITERAEGDDPERKFTCRWTVDGHFRQQACGPNLSERRLTWIAPYIKGDPEAPLKITKRKVYTVKR